MLLAGFHYAVSTLRAALYYLLDFLRFHSAWCLIFALCGTWQSSRVSGSGAPRVSGSSIAAHALARKLTALSSTHGHAGCTCPMCSTAGAATPPKRAEVEHSPSATPRCVVGNLVRARLRDRIKR